MTVSSLPPTLAQAEFEELIKDIRPELHRYVTRMVGSVIDAEDVVQEALVKAYNSLSLLTAESNLRGWLFRIAHNKAIDHLRRDKDQPLELLDEYLSPAEPDQPLEEKELATLALSVFVKLAPRQRSCVILKDVMGYSLAEISEFLNATVPEIKAALHRGRTRLRELARNVETSIPRLDEHERELLARYVDRFNARDFDGVRAMLADELQLDLFGRLSTREFGQIGNRYYPKYFEANDWHLALGTFEGRLAILVDDPNDASHQPTYIMLIEWNEDRISHIRDYRYVPYVMRDAEIVPM